MTVEPLPKLPVQPKGSQKYDTAFYELSSPSLLSMQAPSMTPAAPLLPVAAWQELKSHCETKLTSLKQWRNSWWTQNWSDIAQYILPRRSIWLTQSAGGNPTPNNMTRGRPINQSIVDPTATLAVRTCAGGLMSNLASPSRPWFKMIPLIHREDIDAAGRIWLDDTEKRLYAVIAGSNFYNSFAQECEDLVAFGTGPTLCYEDEQDIIRFYNPAVGEYYLDSGATMRVEGFYRQFVMTVSQIVGFFGLENCTAEIQGLWKEKGSALQQEKTIAHSIEPNYGVGDNDVGKVPGKFPWREVYWLFGSSGEKPLSFRGFWTQPFTASRWVTQSNDAYGRSPGMDVLPDVLQLQVMTKRMAEAIEKMVRPPLLADMQLKNQPSSILPGHVTYVAGLGAGNGMRSIYNVNPDVQALSQSIMQIENRIKVGLFNDLFMAISNLPGDQRTATEIQARVAEAMQVLGPVVENLLTESLKPKLKRIFSIMQRRRMIEPPPESLKGMPLGFDFVSKLALAQKASITGSMERLVALFGNMVAVFPDVTDNLDADAYVNEFADELGVPQHIMRSKKDVAEIRQAKAKQLQAHQDAALANQGAQTVQRGADAANVLSQTRVGDGADALSILMNGGKQ